MIVKRDLTEVLLSAILKANRKYEKISSSWLCDYGVESFMVATLAEEVAEAFQDWYATGYVTLEEPVYNFKNSHKCLIRKRGPSKAAMREGGRVDLALWKGGHGGDYLIGAIEAKRGWSSGEASKDVARLRALKDRYGKDCNGELGYTAFVTFLYSGIDPSGTKMEHLHKKIERWVADNKSKFGVMRFKFAARRHFLETDEGVYCGSAVVIEVV